MIQTTIKIYRKANKSTIVQEIQLPEMNPDGFHGDVFLKFQNGLVKKNGATPNESLRIIEREV